MSASTARQSASIVSARSNGASSDLERRDVVDVDDAARTALERAELVEHPVLRHLEEPRREARPQREPGQALVDAEEDLLRQILGQRPVADEAQDVVVDRPLVRPNDDRERPLVAALGFPEDSEVRLFEGQCAASVQLFSASTPTIYELLKCHRFRCLGGDDEVVPSSPPGMAIPSSSRTVGARSARPPPSRSSRPDAVSDERHGVRRVRRVRADAVGLEHLLGVAVVGRDEADAAERRRRADDLAERGVGRLDGRARRPGSRRCGRPCRDSRS